MLYRLITVRITYFLICRPVNMMFEPKALLSELVKSLEDIQAQEIKVIDVHQQTAITDYMIIATGRASRHVRAIAQKIVEDMKKLGLPPIHSTGIEQGEWALIDLGDFIVHVMQADQRQFYNLEGLWEEPS